MLPIRSFQSRVFVVLLVMGVVPTVAAVATGALAVRELGLAMGTLGPWDAVASSGQALADQAVQAAPGDSSLARAADAHREALSASVRRSRLWALVADRSLDLLPFAALGLVVLLGVMAFLSARWVSGSLARPVEELAGWTQRIARGEPLPPTSTDRDQRVREFARLRTALRGMARELEASRAREVEGARLRAWTEMARRVAHELKNPLTPMRMAATTLAGREEPEVREPAEVLLDEIGRLDTMARAFSQFGRMPDGPPSEVDVGELLDEVARTFDTPGAPVRVSVEEGLPRVRAHYDLLGRAVRNLVSNALEATAEATGGRAGTEGPGGTGGSGGGAARPVELSAYVRDAVVTIAVRDRGPGVPDELLERIWFPETTTKSRGTGLGLATVRQAADAHGGDATVRNRDGGGAEFELRLPVDGAEGTRDPKAPPGAAP